MPERVVDALEVVEVEEHHRGRRALARQRRFHAHRELRAVREPGQRVVPRLVREALLELRHRRERACRLAALERAPGMRADGLQQTPLARAERVASLHRKQADDARVAAQGDDQGRRQADAGQSHAALGVMRGEVDRSRVHELVEKPALGRRGLARERAARPAPGIDLRAEHAGVRGREDERRPGRAHEQARVLEQHPGSRLGTDGSVDVAHDREQRLDLRALPALPHVRAVGQRKCAGGHRQEDRPEEREGRRIDDAEQPRLRREDGQAEPGRHERERECQKPGGEAAASRRHPGPHRPPRQTPVGVGTEISMREIAD